VPGRARHDGVARPAHELPRVALGEVHLDPVDLLDLVELRRVEAHVTTERFERPPEGGRGKTEGVVRATFGRRKTVQIPGFRENF
jgi:hypothetical protein